MSGSLLPTATRASATTAYFRALTNDVFTTIVADSVEAPAGDPLTLVGEHGTLVVGNTSASSGVTISWNTIDAGEGNTEIISAKGLGTGYIDFYAGLTDGVVPTAGTESLRVTEDGIVVPELVLDGAVFTNPKPTFFNWSANCPGGSMVLPSLGTLDVTTNAVVNSAHLYRITFEVYMLQATPATGLVELYLDCSPIVFVDNVPTSAITSALDFRRSYCAIVNPSDSGLKLLVTNTSTEQVNLTFVTVLLEDLGPQPTAPTG